MAHSGGSSQQNQGGQGDASVGRVPGTSGSISLPMMERLKGRENYSSWAFATKMMLIREGSWDAVQRDGEDAADALSLRALATICLSIEPVNYSLVQAAKTAKEAWTNLKNAFQDDGMTRRIGLLRKLTSIRLSECSSVEQYVNDLMSTSHKLSEVGFKVDDTWLASLLLMGLPEAYEPMIMGLEASGARMTADAVKAKILQDVKVSSVPRTSGSDGAFVSQQRKKPTDKANVKCFKCQRMGHYAAECPRKETKEKRDKKGNRQAAFSVFQKSGGSHPDWIFDSGATSHMCHGGVVLHDAEEVSQRINVANNAVASVVATGSASIKAATEGNVCDLTVSNVLQVPDLAINLLSVSKICKGGYKVIFTAESCEVRSASNELVAVGRENMGLYKLAVYGEQMSCAAKIDDGMMLWHRRMGHLNNHSLKQLRSMANGIDFADVISPACVTCLQGKHSRQPFKRKGTRASDVLELVHSDLCGPMENLSIGGSKYFLTFIDDASRKTFVYFLKSKKEVLDCFKDFRAYVETQTGKQIKRLRSDNGLEYVNQQMEKYLREAGIHHEKTVPYNPEQNGLAERMNRTTVEKARCLLFDSGLEKRFWAEAVATAVFLNNRSPTRGLTVTPEERFTGKKPDLSQLRVFGSKVMCHIPKVQRQKWDPKSEAGIFVGYDGQSKGYRVFNHRTGRVTVCRDVVFLDEKVSLEASQVELKSEPTRVSEQATMQLQTEEPTALYERDTPQQPGGDEEPEMTDEAESDYDSANDSVETISSDATALPPQQEDTQLSGVRRSARERRLPGKYQHFDLSCSIIPENLSQSQDRLFEPETYREAMQHGSHSLWHDAMRTEFEALMLNDTWELTDLPAGRRPLKCKWVYKIKTNADGTVDRYKARLVIKGFSQQKGVDYDQTYSPVVRYATVRYLLAVAAQLDLEVFQMDAVTAFLQGELTGEEIYMEQPEGFVDATAPRKVCRLRKALYGLKQASRVWNIKLDAELKKIGLKRSSFDPCVYYHVDGERIIVIAVYVDDFLLFSNQQEWVSYVKDRLMSKFKIKDLGPAEQVLGMRIIRKEGMITLDQQKYIDDLLQRFRMTDCNTVSSPLDGTQRLTKAMGPRTVAEEAKMKDIPFRELVGGLQFLAQCTRPDIAYAVNVVSSFSSNPGEIHWTAAKRILRYLKGTMSMKLVYRKQPKCRFEGFSDADWGNDPDTRRSITGYVFQYAGGTISWSCKKQPTVALSTMEAEYMALSAATQEAVWWRGFRAEVFGAQDAVQISCDNRSALCLAEKEIGYSSRTKHIDLRHHFVREQLTRGTIQVQHVGSDFQRADVLTKAVSLSKYNDAVKNLGVLQIHS